MHAIVRVSEERIVTDPLHAQFRQGDTLGSEYKHWFRATFLQQFRLFYRCSNEHKTIVFGWVNCFDTLRAYDFITDAYKEFAGMFDAGNPPDDWEELLRQVKAATAKSSVPDIISRDQKKAR